MLRRAALVLGLLPPGCGAGSGPRPYDQAGFCEAVTAATCSCCGDCDESACGDLFFGPVRDGSADVVPGHADECRSGYERATGSCGPMTETEALACGEMLIGRAAVGEPCSDPRLCAQEGTCIEGTCVAIGDVGEPCVPFSCDRGLYCNTVEGLCRNQRTSNDACEAKAEPQCAPAFRCVDSLCRTGLPDSAPCTLSAECESLQCEADRCAPTTSATLCD